MKVCATVGCERLTEGNTIMCASCNREVRRQSEVIRKEEQRAWAKVTASKPKRTPIKKVSEKRKVLNQEYKPLREKFLIDHPECEIKLIGCQHKSTQIHHTASGWNKATNLNNTATWKASCDFCNQHLHDTMSAKEARELGLKI